MSAEDYHKAASVKCVKGETLPAGRELTSGELSALMADCEHDTTNAGARDAAIIALMYSCGLRREEVVTLDLADFASEDGRLVVRGKGRKNPSFKSFHNHATFRKVCLRFSISSADIRIR
jgi:site-specific recombinase XerD